MAAADRPGVVVGRREWGYPGAGSNEARGQKEMVNCHIYEDGWATQHGTRGGCCLDANEVVLRATMRLMRAKEQNGRKREEYEE